MGTGKEVSKRRPGWGVHGWGARVWGLRVGLKGGYLVVLGDLDEVQTGRTDRVSEWNERNEIRRDVRDGAFFWGARGLEILTK